LLLKGRNGLATKPSGMSDLEWKGCRQTAVGPFPATTWLPPQHDLRISWPYRA
jgi:hypothetical protein